MFNTPCPTCAFSVHFVIHCILPPFAHIFATLVMHWSISCFFILACHVYLFLCSTLFVLGLSFIFSFILHPSCIIIISHTFISCSRFSLTLCLFLTKRGRAYSKEYTRVFCHFYMTLKHILSGRNSISHAHL